MTGFMDDTHSHVTDRFSDYLDGELPPAAVEELDAHVAACAACRAVLDDLRLIVETAGRLPDSDRSPKAADALWAGIAPRVSAPRRFSFTVPQLVAASLVLALLSGGLVYLALPRGATSEAGMAAGPGGAEAPPAAPDATASAMVPVALVDPGYDVAVADLERTLDEGRARLDPDTVRVLEQNLAVIDAAIAQSRQALEADPANAYLNSHLVSARQRKLALLRRATALTTGS